MSMLQEFVRQADGRSLRQTIEEWKEGVIEDDSKYVYKVEDGEFVYTIKQLKLHFQSRKCKAIILQDQSAYEKLGKLDEKYQKLYVASIVHDIRTPLNGIVGMIEMLSSFQHTPEEEIYLNVARKTCKLLLFLTYDITDYSQLEANRFKPNNAAVNIRDVVGEVHQLLSFSFEKKHLASYVEFSPSVPSAVFVDKNRYMQILLNLEGNALKFTFTGYVKVQLDYEESNDILLTSVRDTGVGISEYEIPRLFKLFGKLESSAGINPQGVGFGLAICKKLSESLGGYINVVSRPGLGSTFTFGIKANLASMERREEGESVSEEGTDLDTSFCTVSSGDIQAKVQEHIFQLHTSVKPERELTVRIVCRNTTIGRRTHRSRCCRRQRSQRIRWN